MDERNNKGIYAKVKHVQGRLVYELKIPIVQRDQTHYGVFSKRGKIGVGFETTKIDFRKMGGPRGKSGGQIGGGTGPSGGRNDGMGPPGGGMGGPGGKGRDFKKPEIKPLELWTKIYLASEP